MTRPPRLELADGLYHVTSRGNERRLIFRVEADRIDFLETLERAVERFHWQCLAYCLMGNHYHFMLKTPIPNLSRGMRHLNGVYAQRLNARHRRVGHLFQGRFKAILVQDDAHLIEAAVYTFRNPVEAKLCKRAETWPWSSYRATLGLEPAPPFLDADQLLGHFGATLDRARAALRERVDNPHPGDRTLPSDSSILHGDAAFLQAHLPLIEPTREFPRNAWQPPRQPLAELLPPGSDDTAILGAYQGHGYRMREIGDHLNLHYATVSRRISRAENRPDE